MSIPNPERAGRVEWAAIRNQARTAFKAAELPPRWGHAWRYTSPEIFLAPEGGLAPSTGARRILPSSPTAGVRLVRFSEAQGDDALVIQKHLGTATGSRDGKLEALDLASWQDGVLVRIAPRATPEEPIHLVTEPGDGVFGSVRLLVVAEEGSMITLIDDYHASSAPPTPLAGETGEVSPLQGGSGSAATPYQLHSTVEIIAGVSACVRYIAIQELPSKTIFLLKQRARAAEDSSVLSSLFSFGGSTARADIGTILEGRNASSRAFGVCVGNNSQHFDHHTVHLHQAPGTRSDFDFRAVLAGNARSIYTGSIVIEKGAPGCEAFQVNRNLMLSGTARADSIPELEIKNDDVKCSHGSATGPVEPIQVYYLMARGLPEAEAVRLVALGFAEQLFARTPALIGNRARASLAATLEKT